MNTLLSEHFLNVISDSYKGTIAYVGQDYRYQFLNKYFQKWFGKNPDEFKGKLVIEFLGQENFNIRKPYIDRALNGEQVSFKTIVETLNGEKIEIEQIYQPHFTDEGIVHGFFAMAYDVKEQVDGKKNSREFINWFEATADIQYSRVIKEIINFERNKIYSLFMQAPFLIVVTKGKEHRIELENSEARKYFKGRELKGKCVHEAMQEFSEQGIVQIMDLIYQTGKGVTLSSLPVQILKECSSYNQHYADISFEPIKNEDGDTSGILCMAVDMTKQVHAIKRLEESEQVFRSYIESMPQMAFIANNQGKVIFLNQKWFEYTGIDLNSNDTWKEIKILHTDDLDKTMQRWNESIKSGTAFEVECRLQNKDGHYYWHLSRALPIKDSKGQISQWVGTITNIHHQKEIESSQSRLLQILESSSDLISMSDLDGRLIYLNGAGKKMLGINKEADVTKINMKKFIFENNLNYFEDHIVPSVLKEGGWVNDFRLKNVEANKYSWIHCNVFKTLDEKTGKVTGLATVARDITEIKQKEKNLEEALMARDQFLSMASHELKTPLTSLMLQSQMTIRNLVSRKVMTCEKQLNLSYQTNQLTSRLNRLIDDMLDVSRIKTGKLRLEKDYYEFSEIVKDALGRMVLLIEDKNIEFSEIDTTEEVFGYWDRFRLEQVINNLLSNAIKYGAGNKIEIKIRKNSDGVSLSVKDYGIGISNDDRERIFGCFERTVHSSEITGLGLGLFISKEIVHSHGGKISVESALGHGSTFHVFLPLKDETSQN
jgi:PAS domain S-box-containing protein